VCVYVCVCVRVCVCIGWGRGKPGQCGGEGEGEGGAWEDGGELREGKAKRRIHCIARERGDGQGRREREIQYNAHYIVYLMIYISSVSPYHCIPSTTAFLLHSISVSDLIHL
jgi:hypothetical protein